MHFASLSTTQLMEVVFFFTFTDHTSPGPSAMPLNFASLWDCLTFKLWSCSVFRLWLTFTKATLHSSGICTSARVPRVLFARDTVYVCARMSVKAMHPCIGWKYVGEKGQRKMQRGVFVLSCCCCSDTVFVLSHVFSVVPSPSWPFNVNRLF